MKKHKVPWVAAGLCVLLAIPLAGCDAAQTPAEQVQSAAASVWDDTIVFDGSTYRRNREREAYLFLGVDPAASVTASEAVGNGGRTDTLVLFVVDQAAKTVQMLEISRDTMVNVDVYDQQNSLVYSGPMQINMQYAFGNHPRQSCYLTRDKVSNLLYGLKLNGYLALTMDGIPAVVDRLGGVPLTMEADCTDIDPAYRKGASVTLDGAAAEKFVRYRQLEGSGGNQSRMERQDWFFRAFLSRVRALREQVAVSELLELADRYLETNLRAKTLTQISEYTMLESLQLPGTVRDGIHDEFYVDEAALQRQVIDLFYVPVEKGNTKEATP